MLIAEEKDVGGVTVDPPEEPPREPWGGDFRDFRHSTFWMEVGAMKILIPLPPLRDYRRPADVLAINPDAIPWLHRWEAWYASEARRVALTTWDSIETVISTVCLGTWPFFDHGMYESAVFVGDERVWSERYETRQEAAHGHLMLTLRRPWNCEATEEA